MTSEEMERMLQKHDEALLRIELSLASVAAQQAKTERSLEFLAGQQADFYAALERLTERQDGFEKVNRGGPGKAGRKHLQSDLVDRLIKRPVTAGRGSRPDGRSD